MKLIIISRPEFFVEEDKIITSLFDEGLDLLHLYKPGTEPLYAERLLTLVPEEYHEKIVVHEHYYMRQEFHLAGIHLNTPYEDIPQGHDGSVSRSCQDLANLEQTKKNSDYVFLHNIFDSNHQPQEKADFTVGDLHKASRDGLIDGKVYAMGGMNAENIKWAMDEGFGGVAVCGDIWNRFDIHQQKDFKDLIDHFVRLRKLVK